MVRKAYINIKNLRGEFNNTLLLNINSVSSQKEISKQSILYLLVVLIHKAIRLLGTSLLLVDMKLFFAALSSCCGSITCVIWIWVSYKG